MTEPDMPRCAIVHGVVAHAPSPDEADTLRQADEIEAALSTLGYAVEVIPVGLDLTALLPLATSRPEAVVNLVEALDGKGCLVHLVPAVLESFNLYVTGCPSVGLFAASNKPFAKRLMRQAGIPTPDWSMRGDETGSEGTWIVKSVWEHASIGLDAGSVVPGNAVAATLTDRAARFGGEWFAEEYIDGREFNISLLGGPAGTDDPEVLPAAEMTFRDFPAGAPRIVDYAAKWDENSAAYQNTVRRFNLPASDRSLLARLAEISLSCWRCFGLGGYARVDFRIDALGRPWVLEVNANPCLAADAGYMVAAERAGLALPQVMSRLLALDPGVTRAAARVARV
ncbi:MAG: D-alanine--D-alanine ligase [Proteobacteria bacterium]|nr:D-alanine--D-alanine ligase [Pseudomonadota bacterium]